ACYQRFEDREWLMLGRRQAEQYFGRASGPFGIPNSLGAFFLLLLPPAGALALRRGASPVARVLWGWLAAAFAFGLVLTISRGAWIGLALALAACPLGQPRWPWRRRAGAAAGICLALALAGAALYAGSARVRERLTQLVQDAGERTRPLMWRGAWQLFRERPLTGTGAGS